MRRSPNPIRIGLVGCGNVAHQYVAQAARLGGRVRIVAACGRPEKRRFALEELGAAAFFTDYRQLAASPDVDLVLVLTPPRNHTAVARAALQAGKHVLVEKPLATTLDDARTVVELARRSPGTLLCAPFTPFSPTFQTLRGRIARGEIGKVVSARGRYGWAGPSWSKWFYQPGGGALFDLGVYSITTLTGLLGPARRVMAMTGVAIPEREINGETVTVAAEDNAQILIDFGGSSFAVVTTGFTLQQYRGPAIEVYGTAGTLQMLGDDWDPDGYELWQNDAGAWQVYKETAPEWPWTDGLRVLVESIENRVAPEATPDHALHVLEIMLQAQASGRDGDAKPLCTTFELPPLKERRSSEPAHLVHDRSRHS